MLAVDPSLIFVCAIVADAVTARLIPQRRRIARFVCMSIFFALDTALIVALIGSPTVCFFQPPIIASGKSTDDQIEIVDAAQTMISHGKQTVGVRR